MQSRGFFATRRSADDTARINATMATINGDAIGNDRRGTARNNGEAERRYRNGDHRYARPGRSHRDAGSSYSRNPAYPVERRSNVNDVGYDERGIEMQLRRPRRRDYGTEYDAGSVWRDALPTDLTVSKPILRNGVSQGRGERVYSSTVPRRGRSINFRDQPVGDGGVSLASRQGYPKSLQDLTGLGVDVGIRDPADASFFSSSRGWRDERLEDGYRRRRYREDDLEDDYLRLYRNLSRLNKYPQGGRYEPGQVHYERECRTFGKDTVAFIYYKTCYL